MKVRVRKSDGSVETSDSLGPSNDRDPHVAFEIKVARKIARSWPVWFASGTDPHHIHGDHETGNIEVLLHYSWEVDR